MNVRALRQPLILQPTPGMGQNYETRPRSSGQGSVSGGRQITRNRASYSCHACRRRKVKCDKVHPVCGNCVKARDDCVYDSNGATRSSPTSIGSTPRNFVPQYVSPSDYQSGLKRRRMSIRDTGDNGNAASWVSEGDDSGGDLETGRARSAEQPVVTPKDIESRLDRLTAMVEELSRDGKSRPSEFVYGIVEKQSNPAQAHPLGLKEPPSHHSAGKIDTDPRQLSQKKEQNHPNEILSEPGHREHEDNFPLPMGQQSDLVDPVSDLTLGHLSLQEGGRSRYVGITYWAYVSDEIAELNQLLRDQNRYYGATTVVNQSPPAAKELTPPASGGYHSANMHGFHHISKDNLDTGHDSAKLHDSLPNQNLADKSLLFKSDDAASSVRFNTMYSEMLNQLPTKRQCHVLYRCYISGVHPVMPIIHPPTILGYYYEFWKWYEDKNASKTPYAHPSFIPLLFAMLYGGSVSCSAKKLKAEFGDISRTSLSARLHDHVTRCLSLVSFPRTPTLPSLIAFLIVQTILAKEEEPLTSSSFIGLGLRVAQIMGLHRDGAQFGLDPCEAELRRRIWWHITHMDSVMSISSGLPPLVNDESYWDVRLVSELKDTLLGTPEGVRYQQAVAVGDRARDIPDDPLKGGIKSLVSVVHVMAQGKYFMAQTTRKILKIQLGVTPLVRRDLEILKGYLRDVETKLNESIQRIPTHGKPELGLAEDEEPPRHPDFDYDPKKTHPPTEEELQLFVGMTPEDGLNDLAVHYHQRTVIAYHRWSRIMLSLLINKAYCIVYQPFLKNVKSKLWAHARQYALRHCHGFMRKFIQLATDPSFQPFQWSWPGSHQPMHPTMIMLIDLFERPHSAEAPRSRAFIDQVFALSGPDGGIVHGEDGISVQRPLREGGREAWDMLRRLRQKAWQKAGLDPDVLWTEKAQINVALQGPSSGEQMMRGLRENVIYRSNSDSAVEGDPPTPRPGTLDAFHGLVKAAQADADALNLNSVTGNITDVEQARAEADIDQSVDQVKTQHTDDTAPSSDVREEKAGNGRPSSRTPHQPHSTAQRPSVPVSSRHQKFAKPQLPAKKDTKASYGPSFSPAVHRSHNGVPSPEMAKSEGSSISSGVHTSPDEAESSQDFDWDQWDAVFGQYVPVEDLMDMDASETWRFGQE